MFFFLNQFYSSLFVFVVPLLTTRNTDSNHCWLIIRFSLTSLQLLSTFCRVFQTWIPEWRCNYIFSPNKPHLGCTNCFNLDEQVEKRRANFLRVVVETVLDSGQQLFQQWMALWVVQDNIQALQEKKETQKSISIINKNYFLLHSLKIVVVDLCLADCG